MLPQGSAYRAQVQADAELSRRDRSRPRVPTRDPELWEQHHGWTKELQMVGSVYSALLMANGVKAREAQHPMEPGYKRHTGGVPLIPDD